MKEKDYCTCCLAEDCDKDMTNEYFFMGTSEVYSKMMSETFNINVNTKPLQHADTRCLICEACITRLRDAASFKRQVLATEQNILKLATLLDTNVVDPNVEFTEDVDDFDDRVSVFSDSDFTWGSGTKGEIFLIKIEDTKQNSMSTAKTTSAPTYSKMKRNDHVLNKTQAKNTRVKRTPTNVEAKLNKANTSKKKLPRPSNDNGRHKNTLTLLQNSNMCIFRSLRTKYGCYTCKETFVDITALREHTTAHANTKYLSSRINQLRGLSYKNVDISDLKCNRCNEHCTDLVDLKKHLTTTHDIDFLNNDHFLIPYRLKCELRCVMCAQKFNTFTRLSIHMNTHYANNVCDVCGLSYINRLSLRMHRLSNHTEKKCYTCGASFMKYSSKITHMKRVHNISRKHKRHCNLCDKTFRYTYMLDEHKINDHRFEKPPKLHCSECSKSFSSMVNLRTHVRSVHIKERNHPCEACGMRFFTKSDRMRHERTHQDVRSFSCTYCDAKFKCKDSCRRHMKKQHAGQAI